MPRNDLRQVAWWVNNIEELDKEIARMCLLCQVRIFDPGIIERVLRKDASVCGTSNPAAFAKLHDLLTFYFENRRRTVEAVGPLETAQIEAHVVEQLRNRFADVLGKWPPG